MIYLVEKLWIDSMENQNAHGYSPVGYVESEEEAIALTLEVVQVSVSPWPLKYANGGDPVPRYRYKELQQFKSH
jgi:hypothetical protein